MSILVCTAVVPAARLTSLDRTPHVASLLQAHTSTRSMRRPQTFATPQSSCAIDRCGEDFRRVLDSVLSKQSWLVGDKFTVAHLSFMPWHAFTFGAPAGKKMEGWLAVPKWHTARTSIELVGKVDAIRRAAMPTARLRCSWKQCVAQERLP